MRLHVQLSLCLLLSGSACRDETSRVAPRVEASAGTAAQPAPDATLPVPDKEPQQVVAQPAPSERTKEKEAERAKGPSAPRRACRVLSDTVLREQAAQVWLSRSLALVLASDRKTLELWSVREATPRKLTSQVLEHGVSKLELARDGQLPALVSWVDDKGGVWLQRIQEQRFEPRARIAEGADRRFAPGVSRLAAEGVLVAFTRTVDSAMHAFVVRQQAGRLDAALDVTPPGHGAASPTFILGLEPPSLVFLDARAGVSPLLEVPFDAQGKAQPAIVRTPINQPYAPPLLRAVALPPDRKVEVAFTATGKLAATAIGRVPLRSPEAPVALHPSRGYGELSFSVALLPEGAVWALEEPISEAPSAPRQVEIKWLDAQGEGAALVLPSKSSARLPDVANGEAAGEVRVGYTEGTTARMALLRCGG